MLRMKRHTILSRLFAAGVIAVSSWCHAAGDEASVAAVDVQRVVDGWSAETFALPADLALDADLRQQIEALSKEHLVRTAATTRGWIAELLRRDGMRLSGLQVLVGHRWLNELVLWQIDRLDDDDDARLLRAVAQPGWCAAPRADLSFPRWALMVQRLNGPERQAALQAQAALLARWGTARADLPSRPGTPWLSDARDALQALRSPERPSAEPPAPPVLMWTFLIDKREQIGVKQRCVLAAWLLQRDVWRQAASRERADLVRFALAWDAEHDMDLPDPDPALGDYPPLAARYGMTGTVAMQGRPAASGVGLVGATIVNRQLQVPGLDGVRPVAFETLLDKSSLQRARTTTLRPAVTDKPVPDKPVPLEVVWRLQ